MNQQSAQSVTPSVTDIAIDRQAFEAIMALNHESEMHKKLLGLSWQDFEIFVKYVFDCAGFRTDLVSSDHVHHHVDLRLYDSPHGNEPSALVEVRHLKSALIRHQMVAAFVGNMALAGIKRGYMVTTTKFTGPAKQAAEQAKQQGYDVCLVDWQHLVRYITYLFGSRQVQPNGGFRTPLPTHPNWLHYADSLALRNPSQTTVVAISNNRGGVAKTTSALSLALALIQHNQRVLLVDLDGQASLTLALPPIGDAAPLTEDKQPSVLDFFSKRSELAAAVRPTRRKFLWLIPARRELFRHDLGGSANPEAELAFVHAIHELVLPTSVQGAGRFDWIIFDTPPAQSSYTRAALAAAHYIILPTAVEPFAAASVNALLETARTMGALIGRGSTVLGSYVVRWPRRPSQSVESQLDRLRDELNGKGIRLLHTRIPEDGYIATANLRMVEGGIEGIFGYRRSAAAKAYRSLRDELEKEMSAYDHGHH